MKSNLLIRGIHTRPNIDVLLALVNASNTVTLYVVSFVIMFFFLVTQIIMQI